MLYLLCIFTKNQSWDRINVCLCTALLHQFATTSYPGSLSSTFTRDIPCKGTAHLFILISFMMVIDHHGLTHIKAWAVTYKGPFCTRMPSPVPTVIPEIYKEFFFWVRTVFPKLQPFDYVCHCFCQICISLHIAYLIYFL